MRKASLGTLFLTVFLDLLGFGLVVPFLPGVARDLGASDFVATLVASSYSLMQFICIPLWGRLSDRVGRRPVLLWSIAASVVGMVILGLARSLPLLFFARIFTGMATANIAVAQAYIADVTTPETRARGMGIIGMAFGLGFIIGPFVGGELGRFEVLGQEGTLAAFAAAGLSLINFVLAAFTLPESLRPESRNPAARRKVFDVEAFRQVARQPGIGVAMWISFLALFWFSGMEVTFRLFTEDAFAMGIAETGRVFAFLGLIVVIVQGGLIHRLSRRFGEVKLVRLGLSVMSVGFVLLAVSPDVGVWFLYLASGWVAAGNGLYSPTLTSYTSRQASLDGQGVALGVVQSMSALARVLGPLCGGLFYEFFGKRAPYTLGAVGLFVAFLLAYRLVPLAPAASSRVPAKAATAAK